MDLVTLIIGLAIVGLILWVVTTYIPMPEPFKRIIIVVVILVLLIWLLRVFNILPAIPVGR